MASSATQPTELDSLIRPNSLRAMPKATRDDRVLGGKIRTCYNIRCVEWGFLVTATVNILFCIIMTALSLARVFDEDHSTADVSLKVLLLVNAVFCLFYVVYGVFMEREFELYVFIGAITIVFVYCIMEFSINTDRQTKVKFARLVVCCIMGPINILFAWKVSKYFKWLEFRIAGASEDMQEIYRCSCRYTSLLKFDFQIIVSLILLASVNGTKDVTTKERIFLGVGIPLALAFTILGWISMRYEKKWMVKVFCVAGILVPALAIFTIFHGYWVDERWHQQSAKLLLWVSIMAAALCVMVRGILYNLIWHVYRNFGKGLKEALEERDDHYQAI